jgi:WD40 repeat protein
VFNIYRKAFVISLLLYAGAFVTPAYDYRGYFDGHIAPTTSHIHGWLLGAMGWLGPLALCFAWYGNLPFLFCLFRLMRGRPPSRLTAWIATGLAFSALIPHVSIDPEVGGAIYEYEYGWAVCLWLAAFAVMFATIFVTESAMPSLKSNVKAPPVKRPTRLIVLTMVAIAGLIVVSVNKFANNLTSAIWKLDTKSTVGALAFSPDGNMIAVYAASDGGTDIWDIKQKQVFKHLSESGVMVGGEQIEYSPNGRYLALCPAWVLSLIDISTGDTVRPNVGQGGCQNAHFSPDGKRLIVVKMASSPYEDGDDIEIFGSENWIKVDAIRTMTRRVGSKYGSQTEHMGCNKPLLRTANQIMIHPDHPNVFFAPSNVFSLSKDGRFVVLSGQVEDPCDYPDLTAHNQKAEIGILDLESRKFVRSFDGYASSLDWNVGGTQIAAAMGLDINIFDVSSGAIVATERGVGAHTMVRYTPDGKYLIEQVAGKVEIWDAAHKRLLQKIRTNAGALVVSADGKSFALGGSLPSLLDNFPLLDLFARPNGGAGRMVLYALK